jgi:PhnB protein
MTGDPFDALTVPDGLVAPRPGFVDQLRALLAAELGLSPIPLPPRSLPMAAAPVAGTVATVIPYLAVHDGAAALDWYAAAFGAEVGQRVAGPDGKLGHAEFAVGGAAFHLADEFPEIGVVSPRTLGGSPVTLHLAVGDVDAHFARAVAAGATALSEPADQPHGARHGTLVDPFGHRWMLSQQLHAVAAADYATAMAEYGYTVTAPEAGVSPPEAGVSPEVLVARNGRVWPAVNAADAPALIRFLVDVLGFEQSLVVPGDDPATIVHSQLRWPEGGIVQVGSANREESIFSELPTGAQSIYLVSSDPSTYHQRCVAAGANVVMPPVAPDYDPAGMVFTVADPEGNLWSVGSYPGEG